jgi:23S rRNA (adenine-N6)-dimethyltransferase
LPARRLAFSPRQPDDAYLVMQVEAAVRFLGRPFGPESEISLLLKAQFDVSVAAWLNRTDFSPPPSVSSVLLRLNRLADPRVEPWEARDFRQFVHGAMRRGGRATESHLRSMLGGAPVRVLANEMNFPLGAPPSEVSFEHWLAAFRLRNWNRIGDPGLR